MSLVAGLNIVRPKTKHIVLFFLFRDRNKKEDGYKAFVTEGWNGWHRKSRLKEHVGGVGSLHNQAMKNCDALLQTSQHINVAFSDSKRSC